MVGCNTRGSGNSEGSIYRARIHNVILTGGYTVKLSYSEYRAELSSLNKEYRDAYRTEDKSEAAAIRRYKSGLREAYPEHSERYAREVLQ